MLDFNKCIIVKSEPELRHILAHMMFAIECLAKKCPMGALDNIKSIEGLIMFDGDDPEDWEKYYEGVMKQVECRSRKVKKVSNKPSKKKCKSRGKKKCKGRK